MSATPTPGSTQPIPHIMLELARLAIEQGFDKVFLGFNGLGYDFPAPIGWRVHFEPVSYENASPDKTEVDTDGDPDHVSFAMVIDEEEPTAFIRIGPDGSAVYWDAEQIRAWICRGRPGAMTLDDADRAACRRHANQMLEAWSNGWSAERKIDRALSRVPQMADYPPQVRQTFTAHNYACGVIEHPLDKKAGASYRRSLEISREGLTGEPYRQGAFVDDQLPFIPMGLDDILAEITSPQPWYVPVARLDEDAEEWVL